MGFGYSKKLFGGAGGGGGGGVTNSATANKVTKSDGTNLVATALNEASAGAITTDAGTALGLTATAPAATTGASQVGEAVTITASPAVASTDTDGAAAGGSVTITAGNAARRVSGDGAGGTIRLYPGTPIGSGAYGKVQILGADSTSDYAAPRLVFNEDKDTGIGNYSNVNLIFYLGGTGVAQFRANDSSLTLVGTGATGTKLGLGASSLTTNPDVYLSRAAAATLQLGAANSATPVAQTLQAQGSRGGTDTDVAGANLTIRPGAGTGAGTAATLIFQTPTSTTTGTTAQTQTTRLSLGSTGAAFSSDPYSATNETYSLGGSSFLWKNLYITRATLGSKSKALTDGSPVTFATFTIADAAMYSGEIIYNVKAVKGTDLQVLAGRARFTAARVGTNYYVSVSQVGTETVAASTGTLVPTVGATGGISISGTGGVISLAASYDTSFASPDSFAGNFRFDSPDAAMVLTFP